MKQLHGSKSALKPFSPAALALVVGLACWSSAALASNEPIPGVDIIVKKNPGGIISRGKTDGGGNYQFNHLAPGDYEICVSGQPCKPVKVGPDGKLRGRIPIQVVPPTTKN